MHQTSSFTALLFMFLTFPLLAYALPGVVAQNTLMRAGPDTKYTEFATVTNTEVFEIYGCLNDWSWCDVQTPAGNRGWIEGRLVQIQNRGPVFMYGGVDRLPIINFNQVVYWNDHYRAMPFYQWRSDNGRYNYYQWNEHPGGYYPRRYPQPYPQPSRPVLHNDTPAASPSKLQNRVQETQQKIRSNLDSRINGQ